MLILPNDVDNSLADFIKNNSLISEKQIEDSVSKGQESGEGIIATILRSGELTEDQIADNFADFYGLERTSVDDTILKNDRPLRDKIKSDIIRQNRIWPLKLEGDNLIIVVSDPSALTNVNNITMLATGFNVETKVITLSDFDKCLSSIQFGDEGLSTSEANASSQFMPIDDNVAGGREGMQALEGAKIAGMASNPVQKVGIVNPNSTPSAADLGLKPNEPATNNPALNQVTNIPQDSGQVAKPKIEARSGFEVIDFVDNILENAISLGISDIHIEAFRASSRVRYRCNGILQEIEEYRDFLTFNYSAITTRLKILASLDIAERRLPQDGGISLEIDERNVDIRVSILPTAHGERVVMRIMDPDAANFDLSDLGFSEKDMASIQKAIHAPQGMILVTGPTGSGKSTTLYAILRELNKIDINIMTAEDPVEYDLYGVGQVKVKDDIGLTFTAALRSFLRQDPEIIMVGEIRDKDTGDIAIKASLTGHLVLSTLHTNDAPSTVTRMINMGIPDYLITSSLSVVIAQRLARVICEHCKEDDTSHPKEKLIAFGFDEKNAAKVKPKMGKGCNKCLDTGVKGRRAIHEILVLNDTLREAILQGASNIELRDKAIEFGFITMQKTGIKLIEEGIITVDEYQRILVLD